MNTNLFLFFLILSQSATLFWSWDRRTSIESKTENGLAFELNGKILRCSEIISNEASIEAAKRKVK